MKKQKSSKITLAIIIVILIVLIITSILYRSNFFDSINTIITFTIQIVSLGISVTALVIAFITYTSIDSVNVISSMEGNVLENENYTIAYSELVLNYAKCRNIKELEEGLYEDSIDRIKNKSNTCIEFADSIQNIIDSILWFAYTDVRSEKCQKKAEELIRLLNDKYEEFDQISNGNQYLLQESIKLINYVLYYQGNKDTPLYDSKYDLINIRGKLLRNPIAKIVYYDYLGLSYNVKAIAIIRSRCSISGQPFLKENIKRIYKTNFQSDLEKINMYLDKAEKIFSQAKELAEEEILWEGYIKYNMARVVLMRALVNKSDFEEWDKLISETIVARQRIVMVFEDLVDEPLESYLIQQFEQELYLSEIVKKNYQLALSDVMLGKKEVENVNELTKDILEDIECNYDKYSKFPLIMDYVDHLKNS